MLQRSLDSLGTVDIMVNVVEGPVVPNRPVRGARRDRVGGAVSGFGGLQLHYGTESASQRRRVYFLKKVP